MIKEELLYEPTKQTIIQITIMIIRKITPEPIDFYSSIVSIAFNLLNKSIIPNKKFSGYFFI